MILDDQCRVLTVQHNLCFNIPARIRISQHNPTLECLKSALTPDEPIKHQQLAASACWALMSSSQKAKGRIKEGFRNVKNFVNEEMFKDMENDVSRF